LRGVGGFQKTQEVVLVMAAEFDQSRTEWQTEFSLSTSPRR
jgi:hypothetical protein